MSRKESSIFRTCFRNERDAVHAQGFGKLTESADFFSVTVSPSVKGFFVSPGFRHVRAGLPVGLFLRIGECSFKNENPKLKRSIWDHVFLPCEQSADEPHGSMIYMPSDRIGKPLRRHSWLSGGWRIQRDPSDPTPHHASHSGQVCFAPKRHTHLGVTRRTLLLDSTTVATTATHEGWMAARFHCLRPRRFSPPPTTHPAPHLREHLLRDDDGVERRTA